MLLPSDDNVFKSKPVILTTFYNGSNIILLPTGSTTAPFYVH